MAIRKRGEYQYQVEIRRTGYPRQTRTFETLADAKAWEREELTKMDQGTFRDARALKGTTLHKALDRYMQEVVSSKAQGGQRNERNRIRFIQKHPIAPRLMTSSARSGPLTVPLYHGRDPSRAQDGTLMVL